MSTPHQKFRLTPSGFSLEGTAISIEARSVRDRCARKGNKASNQVSTQIIDNKYGYMSSRR